MLWKLFKRGNYSRKYGILIRNIIINLFYLFYFRQYQRRMGLFSVERVESEKVRDNETSKIRKNSHQYNSTEKVHSIWPKWKAKLWWYTKRDHRFRRNCMFAQIHMWPKSKYWISYWIFRDPIYWPFKPANRKYFYLGWASPGWAAS